MRQWMSTLKEMGRLKTVSRPVDPVYELAAVGKKADGMFAVRFDKVMGYSMPVVANLAGDRELLATALNSTTGEMVLKFGKAVENQLPCTVVPDDQAPVKETVILEGIDLEKSLPAPVHHKRDGGPYITAAILIAKHPDTGCAMSPFTGSRF